MWAIGVIAFIMLAGYAPFYGDSPAELFERILAADYAFVDEDWEDVSDTAINFIRRLLIRAPAARMTAAQALAHPWLAGDSVVSTGEEKIAEDMSSYVAERRAGRQDQYKKKRRERKTSKRTHGQSDKVKNKNLFFLE